MNGSDSNCIDASRLSKLTLTVNRNNHDWPFKWNKETNKLFELIAGWRYLQQ
jgi:hypothetical protein